MYEKAVRMSANILVLYIIFVLGDRIGTLEIEVHTGIVSIKNDNKFGIVKFSG